ncbi:MAG: DUF3822 family protein [Muribaculaceae bacterium]|nr:DUF3822 family protein [Muribaculaceae bacterium]
MDNNPPIMLTPADFTDTGQWRLIIYISHSGMRAFLIHISDKSHPIVRLLATNWPADDPASLLNNIESAIYDNPRLLDDYATDVIIETSQVCFVPNNFILSVEDAESIVFSSLFPGEAKEILSDTTDDVTALFSMTRGLDGFIARTMPGARLRSHLAVLIENFRKITTADSPAVYADIRDSELDLILFKGKDLISASVQKWHSPEDIAYRIFNMLNAYSINPVLTKVFLSGLQKPVDALRETVSGYFSDLQPTPLPANPGGDDPLPPAALLLAFRK